jgi:formate hydrogenlyase subunit 6/NADH:ubiquinone oxidoreductase subunit I
MFKMTPNVIRNLLHKKATRLYPRLIRPAFENVRGALFNDVAQCTFCGVCAVKCPSQCIAVDKKAGIWIYDPFACVFCGICADICPAESLHQQSEYRLPLAGRETITLKGEPKQKIEKTTQIPEEENDDSKD